MKSSKKIPTGPKQKIQATNDNPGYGAKMTTRYAKGKQASAGTSNTVKKGPRS